MLHLLLPRLGRCRWLAVALVGLFLATAQCSIQQTSSSTEDSDSESDSTGTEGALIVGGILMALGTIALGIITTEDPDFLSRWIDDHEREIQIALARGEGVFVSDLTQGLGLKPAETGRVADALRADHARLSALLSNAGGATDRQATLRFLGAVGEALSADPVLAERLRRHPYASGARAL